MSARHGRHRTLASLLLMLIALAPPAGAEEPGFRLGVVTWGEAGFTGTADRVTYGGRLSADGPVANPWQRPLRLSVRVDITSAPGESFDPADVATFGRSAEARLGTAYRLAQAKRGEQVVATALYAEAGFVTALGDRVLDRYLRQAGIGFEFGVTFAAGREARLRVGYCRDERGGYIGAGQACVAGEVPIGGKGVVLGGDALLNLSRATVTPQRDVFRVFVGVDLSRLYGVIAGS